MSKAIPVSVLADQLAESNGFQFHNILYHLKSSDYVDEKLLKSELSVLVVKIQKLLNSNSNYSIWKGCHAAVVICTYNPLVLMAYGGKLLDIVYQKLEIKVLQRSTNSLDAQGKQVLNSLVNAISVLMNLMRNKTGLSREFLVPKIKAIIPTLITLSQYEPELVLPILRSLIFKHTTTFKPFNAKFKVILTQFLTEGFDTLNEHTQKLVCDCYAYLHMVKTQTYQQQDEHSSHHKTFQDENWMNGMNAVLAEFKPLIELCGEILDFSQDEELTKLIGKMVPLAAESTSIFRSLTMDMNKSTTLYDIPKRIDVLSKMLMSFISVPTTYTIRIPLDKLNVTCSALLSITSKHIPIKRELRRDIELNATINDVFTKIQFAGIRLYSTMVSKFGNVCFSYLSDIFYALSLFIPFKEKSLNIDFEKCFALKREFLVVFDLVSKIIANVGHQLTDIDFLLQLIEIGLDLTEERSLIQNVFQQTNAKKEQELSKTKNKNKKDNKRGSLADLYVSGSQFTLACDLKTFDTLNKFFISIIANQKLATAQMTKLSRYAIFTAQTYKQNLGEVPTTFVELLRTLVIQPGNERVTILPMAVNIIKESSDDVFDILSHPRLPMSILHSIEKSTFDNGEDDEDDNPDFHANEKQQEYNDQPVERSEQKVVDFVLEEPVAVDVKTKETVQFKDGITTSEDQVDTKRPRDEEFIIEKSSSAKKFRTENRPETIPIGVSDETVYQETEKVTVNVDTSSNDNEDDEDDSDFEIPAIELSDDDDEDE